MNNMTTQHMLDRIRERITDDAMATDVLRLAIAKCHKYGGNDSVAIIVGRVPNNVGHLTINPDGTGESNGNTFVIVVRQHNIVTSFWRRDTQPWTTDALRVNRLVGRM
jgi:hypothetical protein